MLKKILLGLAAVIAAILIFAATRPDTFGVQRQIRIQAAPEAIFPLMNSLRNGERWSPYTKKDPQMKGTYSGPESGVGAQYAFAGNQEVGSGRLTITDSVAPQKVVIRLEILTPFKADNVVTYLLEPQGGATQVTWAMEGQQPFLGKLVCLFFDMDKMVGGDFEKGLASLKILAENPQAADDRAGG